MLAPVILFAYNRADCLKITLNSLLKNPLSKDTNLYIFSDGPKDERDTEGVSEVRRLLDSITGFKTIARNYQETNMGLAPSIISGVSQVIEKHGKAIVVEDDLFVSDNFLDWMNQCLNEYEKNESVFSVSAYSLRIKYPADYPYDSFVCGKAHCWGWGTWADRWKTVDWQVKDWDTFKANKARRKDFNRLGDEMSSLLEKYMEGKISSWYIRFCYEQYKQHKLTVYPRLSKVVNEGFTNVATHCNVYNRYRIDFDHSGKRDFNLAPKLIINTRITKHFFKYYSRKARVVGKLKTYLMKLGVIKQYKIKL